MGRPWSVGADRKKSVFKDKKLEAQARFATAVCSFGNVDGGFVYLGIRSDGTVAGLEKDKKLGGFADYEDEFANHIVTRLKELVGDNIFVMNKIKIEFRQIYDKTVCLVQVLPADSAPSPASQQSQGVLCSGSGATGRKIGWFGRSPLH